MENDLPVTSSSPPDVQSTLVHLFLILSLSALIGLLSFSAFLYKSNSTLKTQRNQQLEQVQRVQQTETLLQSMLQDVANFSTTYPELRAILGKYGFSVQVAAPPPGEKK
jgi:hypothetical protein